MKKILSLLVSLLIIQVAYSQNFEFSKVIEAQGTAPELFSKSKIFVTDFWNSAKTVTQNEDKEACLIQIKAIKEFDKNAGMGIVNNYTYKYTVKIQTKDGRCKIDVYDVECTEATTKGFGIEKDIPLIQPFMGDDPGQKTSKMGNGLSKSKAVKMMEELKEFCNSIISEYEKALNTNEEEDW